MRPMALSALMALFPFLIFVTALAGQLTTPAVQAEIVRLLFETWPHMVAAPIAGRGQQGAGQFPARRADPSARSSPSCSPTASRRCASGVNRAYRVREDAPVLAAALCRACSSSSSAPSPSMVLGPASCCSGRCSLGMPPSPWACRHSAILAMPVTALRYAAAFVVLGSATSCWSISSWPSASAGSPAIWPGVLLTFVFWLAGGGLFGIYLADFASYSRTYAGLAELAALVLPPGWSRWCSSSAPSSTPC